MMAATPIYGYRPGGVSRDYHDLDIEENMEDPKTGEKLLRSVFVLFYQVRTIMTSIL